MSDYDPRPPGLNRDPVGATKAGGFYLVGGVLVALVLVAGLMFFNPGNAPGERNDQARMPDRTIETPARPEGRSQTPPDSVTPTNPQR